MVLTHGKGAKPLLVHGSYTLSNKQLLDVWLRAQGAFAKTFGVCRHLAQMHQLQPFTLHLFDDNAQDLLLTFVVFRQKHQTCSRYKNRPLSDGDGRSNAVPFAR